MSTRIATIALDERDADALERLASEEGLTVEAAIVFAVRDYVARREIDKTDWRRRFEELISRIQSHVPPGATPEEIEADARAARREWREARRALNG